MKKNFTLRMMAWLVGAVFATPLFAQEAETTVTETVSVKNDVSLRSDNGTKKNATDKALELKVAKTDGEVTTRFVGLMSFDIPTKSGYAIKSATLRLVTERAKGTLDVYAFSGTVSDDDTYNTQKDNIDAVLETEKLYSAKLNGTNNKAVTDDGASSTLSSWENTIDLTAAVQQANGTLALLLACEGTTSIKVYSSDAEDVTNTKVTPNFTFAAADLKPVLTIVYELDAEAKSNVSTSVADTWVRKGNLNKHGSETTVEICSYTNADDPTKDKTFLGLMSFELPEEALQPNHEIESVTLRLVSERVKGSKNISVYAYSATFAEDTNYATEEENITTALSAEPILTFEAKGAAKAMGSDALTDEYKTADAWTNTLDLTDYAKTLTGKTLTILLQKANSNESAKFYTKEATDVTNVKDASVTFAAADLVPQLTINYKKAAYDLTVTTLGAATLVLPYESTIPEGVKVYTLTDAGNSKAKATEVKETLPANTPVLVSAEAGTYTFKSTATVTTKSESPVSGMLTGVWEKTSVPEGACILWGDDNHELAFYKTTSTATASVAANRAYLTPNDSSASKIDISFSETDGIDAVTANGAVADGNIYTLSGIRVSQPLQKGIYVQNGKKFIVK